MTAVRRWAAALAGVAAFSVHAQVPSWSLEAQQRLIGGPGSDAMRQVAERQRLAEAGELALARGDTEAAERAFDSAARIVHSADIEMGLVRTYMQAGDYRRALIFASHAAGAHRNVPAGTALYGWLLHIGGQGVAARRYLREAHEAFPGDEALRQAGAMVAAPQPLPGTALLSPPLRAAPYPLPCAALPEGTRTAGTALLLGDGRLAVVPAATVRGASQLWVRNAMGLTVAAEWLPGPDATLAVLKLASPLPAVPWLSAPPREPFAGSPSMTVEYVPASDGAATWPLLHQGFFGRSLAAPGDRPLGIDLASGPRGGPVFDALGRLAGMSVPGVDGVDRMVSVDALSRAARLPPLAAADGTAPQARPADRMSVDALYEVGMRLALQVLTLSR
jgi:hypothetical protein